MTVVVGYVPTPEGEAALTAAVAEAERRGEPLHVVNTSRGDSLVDRRFAGEDDLRAVRERLDATGVRYELEQQVRGREAAEEVVDAAERLSASLLVIGLRRRTPTGKLITGSSAQRILLDAPCPVLAVKAAY
ncbi:Nucleotide-binding universal stress protein, UspA family [Geodermatophilus telluris]|jgi:nucleotide-binding universal stress UspA family protein|uniref:Nucleotide-binding universal stress protein, UspA family n=1 Tax=Geodermatophilus telluris TaxID=1190417 RepID=A0A1G6P7E2_9ACTN|nr:universal stress protein [Geodermatophilus telluris]SDC75325.1 Nucleotide-binding universal stress protein, UspA family [Geodermatophilus telluris]